jgi:hypothetical protein
MALNLGAPGDRRADDGTVWLAYPRPNPRKTTGLDLTLDLKPEFLKGGGHNSRSNKSTKIYNAQTPWLFTSSADGLAKYSIPLLGKGDKPARYTVKLYFAELDEKAKPGARVFDVALQGKTVIAGLDVVSEAGGRAKPLVREIENVTVNDKLTVELVAKSPNATPGQWPVLNAIEIVRKD